MAAHLQRALLVFILAFAAGLSCKKTPPPETPAPAESEPASTEPVPSAPPPFTVGVIYRGLKQDSGYNQAHAEAALAIARLPGVKLREFESVAEDEPAEKSMDALAVVQQTPLVFATGFGHFDPWMLKSAAKQGKTTFVHCGGHYREGLHPNNASSFFGYLEEAHYVAGVVAASTSKKKKLGFVASRAIPHVLRSVNAFTLGARSVNRTVKVFLAFTDQWSDEAAEIQRAEKVLGLGVDVLAAYVDAPRALMGLAEKRGAYTVGIHRDLSGLAPKGFLTGAESNWIKIYSDYVGWVREGKSFPKIVRGGLKDGYVTLSPYGPAVSEKTRQHAERIKEQLVNGSLVIFRGPLKDDQGRVVLEAGRALPPRDVRLEEMAYLVEGVTRVAP